MRETSERASERENLLGPRATVEHEEDGLVLLALELLLDVGLRLTYITQSCVCVCTHLCVCGCVRVGVCVWVCVFVCICLCVQNVHPCWWWVVYDSL